MFAHGHLLRVLGARWIGSPPRSAAICCSSPARCPSSTSNASGASIALWNDTSHHAVIPTPRLRGERIGPDHQDALDAVLDRWVESAAEHADRWERDGFGYWIFFDGHTGAAVARGGLGVSPFGVEVGWAVAPDQRGARLRDRASARRRSASRST